MTDWNDDWATEGGYRPDEFYTSATDDFGHRSYLKAAVRPEHIAEITHVIDSGAFPAYTSLSDFVRDAIVHRLHWVAEHAGDRALRERLTQAVSLVATEQRMMDYVHLDQRFRVLMERLADAGGRLVTNGDLEGLEHLLVMVAEAAGDFREPYRTRLIDSIAQMRADVSGVDVDDAVRAWAAEKVDRGRGGRLRAVSDEEIMEMDVDAGAGVGDDRDFLG